MIHCLFQRFLRITLLFSLFAATGCRREAPPMEFSVGVFQDERLPGVSDHDIQEIITESVRMLRVKLGELPLKLKIVRQGTLQQLFAEITTSSPDFAQWQQSHPPLLAQPENRWGELLLQAKPQMISFLQGQWSLQQLSAYIMTNSYEKFTDHLIQEYLKKLRILRDYRLKDGQLLFSQNLSYHSYRHWVELMKIQQDYDLIITNTILVYDLVEQPYPHVIFKHGKVSGSSFESPRRKGYLAGSASMATVFELYANEPYFSGVRTAQIANFSRSEINRALGGYLLAHELGHQIYWIPDVYDHPPGCLMDTRFENLEIGAGYRQLLQHPTACPRCQPYVLARHRIFREQQRLMSGDALAREALLQEIANFPRPADRNLKEVQRFFSTLR